MAGGLLFLAQPSFGQGVTLDGVIVDSLGGPLAGMPVALHRVSVEGGANVDQTASDAEGRFAFSIDMAGDSALYFAATRAGSFLYVGPPIRGGSSPEEYVLIVGPEGNRIPTGGLSPAGAAPASGPTPPARSFDEGAAGTAVLLTAVVVMLAALVFGVRWSRRRRERGRREALLELAQLEERSVTQADPADPVLAERRQNLRRQIVSLS